MLTTNDKEDIHISYLSAVCASASVSFDLQRHDDDSTDGIMKKLITLDDGTKYMSSLRIQLKCTSSVSQYTDDEEILHYKLKVRILTIYAQDVRLLLFWDCLCCLRTKIPG